MMTKLSSNPKVSVIMSVYNAEQTLREAIDSILKQTYTNWEFVICDDCSSDGSYAIMQNCMKRYLLSIKKTVDYLLPEMQEFLLLKESILFFLIRTTGLRRIICLLCMKCNLIIMRI